MSRLLLALLLCGLIATAQAGGVLRSGHPGEPDSLDPHVAVAAPALVVNNDLFESLLTLDARGRRRQRPETIQKHQDGFVSRPSHSDAASRG